MSKKDYENFDLLPMTTTLKIFNVKNNRKLSSYSFFILVELLQKSYKNYVIKKNLILLINNYENYSIRCGI